MRHHRCPVCGYRKLREKPRTYDGGGSFEICPSCGFQFGVSDDDLPDARDGLSRKERVVLWTIATLQAERADRNVPLLLLHGRVLEHVDLGIAELQEIVARLGARR